MPSSSNLPAGVLRAGRAAMLRSASAAALAVCAAGAAHAQAQSPPAADDSSTVSEVVVTGSRIQVNGYSQPTPVTVVGAQQLANTNPGLITEAVAQLPAVKISTGATFNNNLGVINFVNLRALGPNRTLVLLDGRRLPPSTTGNAPDVNTLPQALVSRIDVVTGGASAVYGSDAVAGVVNFILDTRFDGLKTEAQYGFSNAGDDETVKLSVAGGRGFADGRGHLIASAEYYDSKGISDRSARSWVNNLYQIIPNPAVTAATPASPTNPNLLLRSNVRYGNSAVGGLITSGPLAGVTFGAGGAPTPFTFGALRSTTFAVGGDGAANGLDTPLASPIKRYELFTHAEFDLSPTLTVYGEASYSNSYSANGQLPSAFVFTIFPENPFIPAGVRGQATQPFTLARTNLDYGLTEVRDRVESYDLVAGARGELAFGAHHFTWDGYVAHGQTTYSRHVPRLAVNANVYNAVDAVQVTAANVGTSGLALGSIVCRTSLTLPTNGCTPLNVFGPNAASQAALDYIHRSAFFEQETKQTAAGLNLQGSPFSNWAGEVSFAIGAEYRKVDTAVTSDALSQTVPADYIAATAPGLRGFPAALNTSNKGVFLFGNFQPIRGGYNVKEAYAEMDLPLARDWVFARKLDLNAAVRLTSYSTAGDVTTWKIGGNWQPLDGLRFRATRSRDIRAPNIADLYSAARQIPSTIIDPTLATANNYGVVTYNVGNLNLKPEEADTTTAGVVVSPSAVPGLQFSADYYSIEISGAIQSPAAQDVINGCANGSTPAYCGLIQRGAGGRITTIQLPNVNVATITEKGWDFEGSYRTDLAALKADLPGTLTLRALANYTDSLIYQASATAPKVDRAGDVGFPTATPGVPHWTGQISAQYVVGKASVYIQERYVGGGALNNTYNTAQYNAPGQPITYIDTNKVAERYYTDVTLKYRFGDLDQVEAFLTVTNLFNKAPPPDPNPALPNLPQYTNTALYDVIGRDFTLGVRARF